MLTFEQYREVFKLYDLELKKDCDYFFVSDDTVIQVLLDDLQDIANVLNISLDDLNEDIKNILRGE